MRNISDTDREQLKARRRAEREAIQAERKIRNAADLEQIRMLRAAERERIQWQREGCPIGCPRNITGGANVLPTQTPR